MNRSHAHRRQLACSSDDPSLSYTSAERWVRRISNLATATIALLACWLVTTPSEAIAGKATLAYSFVRDGGGGVAQVQLDEHSGKFTGEQVVFESAECTRPEKLRHDVDRNLYVLTNETDADEGPHLFLVPNRFGDATTDHSAPADRVAKSITLPAAPDEVRLYGPDALLTCDGDWLVRIDVEDGVIRQKWNTGKIVDPPANGPQDVRFLDDGNGNETVIVSFQKDSRKGKKKGSRLAAFRWPEMETIADSALPRSRPDLHIQGNKKESGPGPEIVHVSAEQNRILATLDLYGALAIGSLETFLNGDEVAWKYLPTSTDGSWGNSFPDRMSSFDLGGTEVALVTNSGVAGGVALFDLAKQSMVWSSAAPPGLETPVFIPELQRAFTVCSGKQKARGRRGIEKTFIPRQGVYAFDFREDQASKDQTSEHRYDLLPTDIFMFRISRVGQKTRPWLIVAGGRGSPDTLMTLDPRTGKFVDERPAIGSVKRFEQD